MAMIFTNRNQRSKRYIYTAQDVVDLIDNVLTTGRIRQISRGFRTGEPPIGWSQFRACCPTDGEFQFPFPADHKYSEADVDRVIEFIDNARKTNREYTVKFDRWYSESDIAEIVRRSKKLIKCLAEGTLPRLKEIVDSTRSRKKRAVA
jgi:hypothetical protein